MKNIDEWDALKPLAITMIAFLCFLVLSSISSFFWYEGDTFTATVSSIDYYGQGGIFGDTNVNVKFDDGRVYDLDTLPDGLREGHTYRLEYRVPYASTIFNVSSPTIVILD
ncbi:hypothetical protein LCGC14_0627850 [marine sediment metagenome]|uniref:Uncharacterized protein n=1 Tax=marine sediment metagenome TaxID=412755 RepID=A0A0F9R2V1_9ZZZZ